MLLLYRASFISFLIWCQFLLLVQGDESAHANFSPMHKGIHEMMRTDSSEQIEQIMKPVCESLKQNCQTTIGTNYMSYALRKTENSTLFRGTTKPGIGDGTDAAWLVHVKNASTSGQIEIDHVFAISSPPNGAQIRIHSLVNNAISYEWCAVSAAMTTEKKTLDCTGERTGNNDIPDYVDFLTLSYMTYIFKIQLIFKSLKQDGVIDVRLIEVSGAQPVIFDISPGYYYLKGLNVGQYLTVEYSGGDRRIPSLFLREKNETTVLQLWYIEKVSPNGWALKMASDRNLAITTDNPSGYNSVMKTYTGSDDEVFSFKNGMFISQMPPIPLTMDWRTFQHTDALSQLSDFDNEIWSPEPAGKQILEKFVDVNAQPLATMKTSELTSQLESLLDEVHHHNVDPNTVSSELENVVKFVDEKCAINMVSCDKIRKETFTVYQSRDKGSSDYGIFSQAKHKTEGEFRTSDPAESTAAWIIHVPEAGKPGQLTTDLAFLGEEVLSDAKITVETTDGVELTWCAVNHIDGTAVKCISVSEDSFEDHPSALFGLHEMDHAFKFQFHFDSTKNNGLIIIKGVELFHIRILPKNEVYSGFYTIKCGDRSLDTGLDIYREHVIVAKTVKDREKPRTWLVQKHADENKIFIHDAYRNGSTVGLGDSDHNLGKLIFYFFNRGQTNQQFIYDHGLIKSAQDPRLGLTVDKESGIVVVRNLTGTADQIWTFSTANEKVANFTDEQRVAGVHDNYIWEMWVETRVKLETGYGVRVSCFANKQANIILLFNGEVVKTEEMGGDLEYNRLGMELGTYKCIIGNSVATFDPQQETSGMIRNVEDNIRFIANNENKTVTVRYIRKRKAGRAQSFKCYYNTHDEMRWIEHQMNDTHEKKTFTGPVTPSKNNYVCKIGHDQMMKFSYVYRNVLPKITNFDLTLIPYNELIKVRCAAISKADGEKVVPARLTLYYEGQRIASTYALENMEIYYRHNSTETGEYKCIVNNIFGEDSAMIKNRKKITKSADFGSDGGVLSLKARPYNKESVVSSSFDFGQKYTCKLNGDWTESSSEIIEEEKISTYRSNLGVGNAENTYSCQSNTENLYKNEEDRIKISVTVPLKAESDDGGW